MKNALARIMQNYIREVDQDVPANDQPASGYHPLVGIDLIATKTATESVLQSLHDRDQKITNEIERLTEQRRQTRRVIVSQESALRELAADIANFRV